MLFQNITQQEGALYLKNLRILRWSGEPNSVMDQLQDVMPLLSDGVAALLSRMPVYTLDESDIKQMLIKKFAKEIKVEKGTIGINWWNVLTKRAY